MGNTTTGIIPARTRRVTISTHTGRHVGLDMIFSSEFSPAYRTRVDLVRGLLPITLIWRLAIFDFGCRFFSVHRGEAAGLILIPLVSLLSSSPPNNGCIIIPVVRQIDFIKEETA